MRSMPGDAQATKQRLIEAATAAFAAHGLAGARVDRIAAEAGSNKAQIYHHFGSKDQLFDAVFDAVVEELGREIPIDADDLPGYAARLAQAYQRDPDVLRLLTWQRLERGTEAPSVLAVEHRDTKIAKIAQAQADGRLSDRYPADVLLLAVLH